jgi:hypothetical protein
MSEMVDRAVKAIAEKFAPAIDMRAPYAKVMVAAAARAVIEALREPTEAMIDAVDVSGETDAGGGNNATYLVGKEEAAAVWRAMIDEALK